MREETDVSKGSFKSGAASGFRSQTISTIFLSNLFSRERILFLSLSLSSTGEKHCDNIMSQQKRCRNENIKSQRKIEIREKYYHLIKALSKHQHI